jgi:hypothetical protein
MDGVEKLVQMNEVERMREVMDVISDNMRKQNDKDRMEMQTSRQLEQKRRSKVRH